MPEVQSSSSESEPRLKKWPNESANEIAETIEKAFEGITTSDSKTITVQNDDGSNYIFRPTQDTTETPYYPDNLDKSLTIGVIHSGPEVHERFYFKVFRPNFFKYEELPQAEWSRTPNLVETGATDVSIQLYDESQHLIGEISCKDGACTEENGKAVQDKTSELISGILQKELDRNKVIKETKVKEDDLRDEVETNPQ